MEPTVKIGEKLYKEKAGAYVDKNWFNMFQFDFIQGSIENFNSLPNSVVISASNAKKYFGNKNAIGQTLRIADVDCIVQG
jgi:putative ABC transport system permease protein